MQHIVNIAGSKRFHRDRVIRCEHFRAFVVGLGSAKKRPSCCRARRSDLRPERPLVYRHESVSSAANSVEKPINAMCILL